MRSHHHQISQLIDNDDNRRKLLLRLIGKQLVIALHVAHPYLGNQPIALFHFLHCPVQHRSRLFGIGNHRHHQVRNIVVHGQLHHLWVYQDKLDLCWLCLEQHAGNQGVDAHRLTGAGGTSHQQMGHFRQIGKDGLSADILAQAHCQLGLGCRKGRVFQHFPQLHAFQLPVRHLDADSGLAGNLLNAHRSRRHVQGYIVSQPRNLADLDPRCRLHLITGDSRSVAGVEDGSLHLEIRQSFPQDFRVVADFLIEAFIHGLYGLGEQMQRWQLVWRRWRCCLLRGCFCCYLLHASLPRHLFRDKFLPWLLHRTIVLNSLCQIHRLLRVGYLHIIDAVVILIGF